VLNVVTGPGEPTGDALINHPMIGLGREGGRPAIESYTELKTVLLPFTDEMM
jgi:acyl-CoA reductase-like NAD-dependent aldehyde dehydrogenase